MPVRAPRPTSTTSTTRAYSTKDLKFTMSAPMTYTRMNEADGDTPASTDTVIIHNNKGADESVGYETHYEGMDPTRPVGDDDGAITVVAPDAGNDVITDSVTIEGTGSIISIAADGTTGDSVKGTFHGLAGTFACASGCTINVLSDGKYQTEATDLMFTPTLDTSDGADPAADQVDALKVTIADPDYMHWGVWINEAKDKDGMPVTKVSAFFGGTMASRITTAGNDAGVRDLEGTASYAGPATGVYVRKEFGAGGDPEHLYSGQFSATASLTARFGGGNVAANDQFSVVGKVTNFMDGDEIVDADWAVTLGAAPFGTSATTVTDDAPMFAGMTSTQDDAKGVTSGNWQGQFFGAVTDDDANTADEDETVYPSGIAGQFNGHFTNGHVLGAFGAKKQ